MCGIVAVWGNSKTNKKVVFEMLSKINHRGPDEIGFCQIGSKAFLGHTRLSIIDLKSGKQPIFNQEKTLAIIFNGEIYNFKELQKKLKTKYILNTKSDTEVLLYLYEELGEDCFQFLEGMFALMIAGEKGFLLARDPLGIKPLYYGMKGKQFLIASELKAFPFPMDQLFSLPPGSYMVNGEIKRFANPLESSQQLYDLDKKTVKARLKSLLEEAVEKRLVADVPVGVFLSGGFDSSLVASIMQRRLKTIHSFTAGMKGAPDIEMAKEMADFLGTKHHQLFYSKMDMEKAIEKVIYHLESFDAPLVRSSIPMYFISKVASENVKVVLSGEGADELFAGYAYLKKFRGKKLREELNRIIIALNNTNLQRADRISMAHGLEVRVPFLDYKLLKFSLRLNIKFLEFGGNLKEKHLLRETFRDYLPEKIRKRKKMKFSVGAGSFQEFFNSCEEKISDSEFRKHRKLKDGSFLRSKEEYYYYKIYNDIFGNKIPLNLIGRTVDRTAGTEIENVK